MKPAKGQKTASLIECTLGNSSGNNAPRFLSPCLAASIEPQNYSSPLK